tara:strand:- start:349 stop:573 length:225 start_codon:yes stop_codon:yes gene_type:complete
MGIFRRIADLFAKKQEIEKEIATLQNSCKHFKKSVKQVREYGDSSSLVIRYVCDECLLPIGYPNNEETKNYLKQ